MVRRNRPVGPSAEFAAAWAQLPAARQRSLIREVQDALREAKGTVRNEGAVQPVHPPFTGRHAHPHYPYGGGETGLHSHSHEHDDDADHGHDHEDIDAAIASGEAAKRARRQGRHEASVHDPMTHIHQHSHANGRGGVHYHVHQHQNDAAHGSHEHTGRFQPGGEPEARSGRQVFNRVPVRPMPPQQAARVDQAFDRLAATAAEIERRDR